MVLGVHECCAFVVNVPLVGRETKISAADVAPSSVSRASATPRTKLQAPIPSQPTPCHPHPTTVLSTAGEHMMQACMWLARSGADAHTCAGSGTPPLMKVTRSGFLMSCCRYIICGTAQAY